MKQHEHYLSADHPLLQWCQQAVLVYPHLLQCLLVYLHLLLCLLLYPHLQANRLRVVHHLEAVVTENGPGCIVNQSAIQSILRSVAHSYH